MELQRHSRRFREGDVLKRGDCKEGQKVLGRAGPDSGRKWRGGSSAARGSASVSRELGASGKAHHRWERWLLGPAVGPPHWMVDAPAGKFSHTGTELPNRHGHRLL